MFESFHEVMRLVESGWERAHVLVIGDAMLDKYVWGEVERISPEAPVPVVRAAHRSQQPGGAGNVAMNLAGLGAGVTLLGRRGDDEDGESLERLLTRAGVRCRLVPSSAAPTISKLRILGGNQQMLRLDTETVAPRDADADARLLRDAAEALATAGAAILSDYSKGLLNEEICQAVVAQGRSLGVPVLVDPKGPSFHPYRGATTICPNLHELARATGIAPLETELLLDAGQRLVSELRLEFMAVTMSDKGIAILYPEERIYLPATAREVFDVSGAGDTAIATLALGIAARLPIAAAGRLANLAAGVVVGKVGTVPIQRYELAGALSGEIDAHAEEKVLTLDRLRSRVASWRSLGQTVAFTNGCFDILHIGHISLLSEAARQADRLVVAINDDASVRRLKGPGRPAIGQQERAAILAALAAVDAVAIFSSDSPLETIEAIRPDVLVKGGNYAERDTVGAPEVRAWGGTVKIFPLVEGVSTAGILARAAASAGEAAPGERGPG
jgi:D-beta-D-heptose 7-phosphate kinase/D-beta-D-heptose 1-phosphate adenosyltransferase